MWKHLKHQNILPLLGVNMSKSRFAMISEWMENGNINEFIKKNQHRNRTELVSRLLISVGRWLIRVQLVGAVNGLVYMHSLHLVHGDLKGVSFFSRI